MLNLTLKDYNKYYDLSPISGGDEGDILFIQKEDMLLSHDDLVDELDLNNALSEYDYTTGAKSYTGQLRLDSVWGSVFNHKEVNIIKNVEDRLTYAYACLHDDTAIEAIMKKHCPEILSIIPPTHRYTAKPYLDYWMTLYNFTLEDFLLNDKYVIISDKPFHHIAKDMLEIGLLDMSAIEKCSDIDIHSLLETE